MGMTAVEKVLARTAGRAQVQAGDVVYPDPDFIMIHDGLVRGVRRELDALGIDRLAAPDNSLNAPLRGDAEGGEWQDWLVDESDSQEKVLGERQELNQRQTMLSAAMKGLNKRERHILTERRLKDEPTTLEELSQKYGISRERVRQIEVRAFEKLQKAMKNAVVEQRMGEQLASA